MLGKFSCCRQSAHERWMSAVPFASDADIPLPRLHPSYTALLRQELYLTDRVLIADLVKQCDARCDCLGKSASG